MENIELRKLNVLCLNYLLRKTSVQEELDLTEKLKKDNLYRSWFDWLSRPWLNTALIKRRYDLIKE